MKAKTGTKKMKFRKRLLSMVAAVLMAGATMVAAVPVQAANVSAQGGTTTFDKYLVMDADANVPNTTFDFTIAPGTAVDATDDSPAIYAGIGSPAIGSAIFTPEDVTTSGTPTNPDESNKKYATQTVTVDFSSIFFTAPGIYRYIITETPSTDSGITNDAAATRTLDVYVEYDGASDTNLKVSGYVLHTGDEANPTEEQKSAGFTNTYTTNNLTLTKDVTGNQGNRDKYFEFTVNITGAVEGTVYTVDLSGAEANPSVDGETKTNLSSLTVGEDGNITETYYLKDDQSIVIQGITAATQYQITESDYSKDGYTTTYTLDSESAMTGNTFDARTMDNESHTVLFTNNKAGVVPTGILLETAPYLILGVIVIAGVIALFVTRRRRAN